MGLDCGKDCGESKNKNKQKKEEIFILTSLRMYRNKLLLMNWAWAIEIWYSLFKIQRLEGGFFEVQNFKESEAASREVI